VIFSERVNPLSITSDNFFLINSNTGQRIPANVAVGANLLSAQLTSTSPLQAQTQFFWSFNATDLAGNFGGSGSRFFTTGTGIGGTASTVTQISPPNGATGVPVNAQIVARMSTPVDP